PRRDGTAGTPCSCPSGTSRTMPGVVSGGAMPSTTTVSAGAASAAGVTSSASRVSSAMVARPRVDESVDEVHEEVRGEHGERDHEERPLHEREVARLDRVEQELAQARVAEHLLHDDRARDHEPERDAEPGERREGRVAR